MKKMILILGLFAAGCSTAPKHEGVSDLEAKRVIRGSANAKVTIIEYGDFQCPACAFGATSLKASLAKYTDQVRFIYKHLPLPYHPQARPAAHAFEVLRARDPAKAYEFYEMAYAKPGLLNSKSELEKILKKFDLTLQTVDTEFMKLNLDKMFEEDRAEFIGFGFRGTPVFIVNGQPLEGAPSVSDFDQVISETLKTLP